MNNGSSITGNTGSGSVIYIGSTGTFTMSGGSITGNTISADMGTVRVIGAFTMNGGSVTGTTSNKTDVMVENVSGGFTMGGGAQVGKLLLVSNGGASHATVQLNAALTAGTSISSISLFFNYSDLNYVIGEWKNQDIVTNGGYAPTAADIGKIDIGQGEFVNRVSTLPITGDSSAHSNGNAAGFMLETVGTIGRLVAAP
jgi:hypothetical protein